MKKTIIPALVFGSSSVMLALTAQSAQAFTFGNLDSSAPFKTVAVPSASPNKIERAYQFTFNGSPDYKLENVQLAVNKINEDINVTDTPDVRIIKGSFSDTQPFETETLSVSLTNLSNATSGIQDVTFTPDTNFSFESGETYWLYVASETGAFDWRYSETDPTSDPTGIADFNKFVGKLGNSASWGNNTASSAIFSGSGGRGLFAINATKVPEPGNLVGLFSVVGLGLMSFKRKK